MALRDMVFGIALALLLSATAGAARFAKFGNAFTEVNAISDYGGIMVGAHYNGGFDYSARRWTSPTAFTNITNGHAYDASANGDLVVGTYVGPSGNGDIEAFHWSASGGTTFLGHPPGESSYSNALAISPKGDLIAGVATKVVTFDIEPFTYQDSRAFLWPGGEVLPLPSGGSLGENNFFSDVSENLVVTGYQDSGLGDNRPIQPFIYSSGFKLNLGHLPGASIPQTTPRGISKNGTVVVGSGRNSAGNTEAFRWTFGGGMVGMGTLPGFTNSEALAASADGSVIVGRAYDSPFSGGSGFYWTAEQGMRSIDTVLQGANVNLGAYHVTHGIDVSANGLSIIGHGTNSAQPFVAHLPQIVGLAWDVDMPVEYFTYVNARGETKSAYREGTTPAMAVSLADRAAFRHRLQDIFILSGIENVLFQDGEVAGGTNVYISAPLQPNVLYGEAITGIDQFNQSAKGSASVFWQGDLDLDAETAAHEVGHLLGLRHVDPAAGIDPDNREVMDYGETPALEDRFRNGVSQIREKPDASGVDQGITHNPRYHLKRYVDGWAHADLVAAGLQAGDWELEVNGLLPDGGRVNLSLDLGSFASTLYDVYVVAGESDTHHAGEALQYFSSTSTSALAQLSFQLAEGELLQLAAATTPGGPLDLLLTTCNPFDDGCSGAAAGVGSIAVQLQHVTDPITGAYTTVANGTLVGMAPLDGDYNLDGAVNAADSIVWRKQFGLFGDGLLADGDGNGQVDLGDLGMLVKHFGETSVSGLGGAEAHVPEPGISVLLLMGLLGGATRRSLLKTCRI